MTNQRPPTPDEIIARAGCGNAGNIERCLLDVCDRELHRPEEEPQDVELAFNCVRAVILRLDGNEAPEVQPLLAGAVFRRAQFLAQFDRPEEARHDFQDVAATWGRSTDLAVRRIVAANYLEAGQFEEDQGNIRTAEQCYGLAAAYADDPDPITQKQAVDALCNHVDIFIKRGWMDVAAEKVAEIRARWQDHAEYWIRRRVANLLVGFADGMKQNDEYREESLALHDDAIAYANRGVTDPPAYFIQAGAWLSKCSGYEKLERHEEATACVDAFERWMEETVRPNDNGERPRNAMAEGSLRRAYLIKARCLNEIGRHSEAEEAFKQSGIHLGDLGEDFDKRQTACKDMLRLVKILVDLGRKEEAEDLYDEICRRMFSFGKESMEPMTLFAIGTALQYIKNGPDWFEKQFTSPSADSPDPS